MTEAKPEAPAAAGITFQREFAAPRDVVWQTLTDVDHLSKWMAPQTATFEVKTFDLSPGGEFHFCMQFPGGGPMWQKFAYREVVAPKKLVYVYSGSNENGDTTPNPWGPHMPAETLTTLTLEYVGGKTVLTFAASPINATPEQLANYEGGKAQAEYGAKTAYEGLAAYVAKLVSEYLSNRTKTST